MQLSLIPKPDATRLTWTSFRKSASRAVTTTPTHRPITPWIIHPLHRSRSVIVRQLHSTTPPVSPRPRTRTRSNPIHSIAPSRLVILPLTSTPLSPTPQHAITITTPHLLISRIRTPGLDTYLHTRRASPRPKILSRDPPPLASTHFNPLVGEIPVASDLEFECNVVEPSREPAHS